MSTIYCQHHCREGKNGCGAHFTSLEAFDAHRQGSADNRTCAFPENPELVELTGTCRISDPLVPKVGVTIYEATATEAKRASLKALRRAA